MTPETRIASFEASAFHPELPGGRGPGTLRVEPGRAVFHAGGAGLPGETPLTLELPFPRSQSTPPTTGSSTTPTSPPRPTPPPR